MPRSIDGGQLKRPAGDRGGLDARAARVGQRRTDDRGGLCLWHGQQRRRGIRSVDHLQQAEAQAEQGDQHRDRDHAQRVALQPGRSVVTASRTPRRRGALQIS